jgi:hypothetical protein
MLNELVNIVEIENVRQMNAMVLLDDFLDLVVIFLLMELIEPPFNLLSVLFQKLMESSQKSELTDFNFTLRHLRNVVISTIGQELDVTL